MVAMVMFPKELERSPGVSMILDPTHLLLVFKKPYDRENIKGLLKEYRLVLETGINIDEKVNDNQKDRVGKIIINHTNLRFWVSLEDKSSIDYTFINRVKESLENQLDWIGPVYRIGEHKGLENLVCPLPNVLIIRPSKEFIKKPQKEVIQQFEKYGLKYIPEKSKFLINYLYFEISDLTTQLSYQTINILRNDKEHVEDVRFENMPMIKPILFAPDDQHFDQQWNMTQIQAGGLGFTGWDLNRGNDSVIVAIIDTGCDLTHPDLQFSSDGINLGSMAGDGSPTGLFIDYHGTACAGVAAATIDNAIGVAGVAGNCLILPIAFQNWTDVEVASGINYASVNGAHVISMSFGEYDVGDGESPSGWDFSIIDPSIQDAYDSGCILVAASGNDDIDTFNRYPARHPLVICVGASDQNDNRKNPSSPDGENWGSNYAEGVSVVAPGVLIPTADIQGNLGRTTDDYNMNFGGTSAATPHVAGLAALLICCNYALRNYEIKGIIEETADKVGVLPYSLDPSYPNGTRNNEMGYGRINVFRALYLGISTKVNTDGWLLLCSTL